MGFSTLLEPFLDPKIKEDRERRQAELMEKIKDSAAKLGVTMKGLTVEQQLENQQTPEYQEYLAEVTAMFTEMQNAATTDFSAEQMAEAWELGEERRCEFRIRLFQPNLKTIGSTELLF